MRIPVFVTVRTWEKGALREEVTFWDFLLVKRPNPKQPTLDNWSVKKE